MGKSRLVLSVWCELRPMLEQAHLPFIWRLRPLRLCLCPPAALCCQVRPEGPALIMAMSLTVTLTRDVAMSSAGQDERGTPRPVVRYPETRGPSAVRLCVCVCVLLACVWSLCIKMGHRMSTNSVPFLRAGSGGISILESRKSGDKSERIFIRIE